ncbi:hypothetical protein GOP47_0009366 [Adiantum capillus-veneris]|uniref:SHSP domain-containing protein n=1 Tax=Adiantum capillus-veneris TaxID=13818 RepID=A0A9D4UWV9_ADICA|nr:hypothetical protein GOP47_0009366 [Adiantum capillus-veneris]
MAALSNVVLPSSTTASSSFPSATSCRLRNPLHSPYFVRPATFLAAANGNGSQQGEAIQQRGGRDNSSIQQGRRPRDTSVLLLDSWDPFSRGGLRQVMETMDRLFLDDWATVRNGRGRVGSKSSPSMRAPWDVIEDEEAFHIRVDMPGFSKEDVKVAVEDGVLVVSAERDPEKEDSRWAAKSYSKFKTRLALPEDGQVDKISAEMKNGVLFVSVPKVKPEDKKQVINVDVA